MVSSDVPARTRGEAGALANDKEQMKIVKKTAMKASKKASKKTIVKKASKASKKASKKALATKTIVKKASKEGQVSSLRGYGHSGNICTIHIHMGNTQ